MVDEKKNFAVPVQSHASELLASERTFLAWIRTSIAILSFGFAIIRFDVWVRETLQQSGGPPLSGHWSGSIGGFMVLIGGLMSAVGAIHYRRTNDQIISGQVKASNWLVLSISGCVVLLSIVVILYLVYRGEY
jgi:putative membrane protein